MIERVCLFKRMSHNPIKALNQNTDPQISVSLVTVAESLFQSQLGSPLSASLN